jgi:gamma-glutamylaminecyclotransferase
MRADMPLLFVYGSLKEGFPNFHANRGRRLPGTYRTAEPHPMYLVDAQLPCLFLAPGRGLPVSGQLFEVDAAALRTMDELERVGRPGGYRREPIAVVRTDGPSESTTAFVYVQDEGLLAATGSHLGPLGEYTLEHSKALRW